MTKEEITEGNKLIAEFMGMTQRRDGKYALKDGEPLTGLCIVYAKFHSSWDWIMRVVEKIEDIRVNGVDNDKEVQYQFSINICKGCCTIDRDILPQYYGTETDFLNLYDSNSTNKIMAVYKAALEFIKWYNSQPK